MLCFRYFPLPLNLLERLEIRKGPRKFHYTSVLPTSISMSIGQSVKKANGSSFGIPNQNVPTTIPVKMMKSNENFTPVTKSGPSYHLSPPSIPCCPASSGVASPSSAKDGSLKSGRRADARKSSGSSWMSTEQNEGGDGMCKVKDSEIDVWGAGKLD